ncbi:MAG: hypothetical protein LBN09_02330 [Clostridioides sp.]|jgi:hypothetical protein|nr:hypothetical protein [Clostridioides sp.]
MNRNMMFKTYHNRRRAKRRRIVVTLCCLVLIGGYSYTKLKDTSIIEYVTDKVAFWNKSIYTSDNIKDELANLEKEKGTEIVDSKEKDKDPEESKTDAAAETSAKVATIKAWNAYTVQVMSGNDEAKLKKVQDVLLESKIPFSVVEKDGAKKVQAYCYFDKDKARTSLGTLKAKFPDAFISEIKAPLISLKYTDKFASAEDISKNINELADSFVKESEYLASSKDKIDVETYKKILQNRQNVIENLKKNTEKIDYQDMKVFKENLLNYAQKTNDKIITSIKACEDKKIDVSEGLMISSVQDYVLFVNSIK